MKVNVQWAHCVYNFSYSFIPILLKFYRCLDHGLKMCMWFGYYPQIILILLFRILNFIHFWHFNNEIELTKGSVCEQLLVQFYSNSFETL